MKKLLFLASLVVLLAAGCNTSTQSSYQASSTPPVVTPQPTPTTTTSPVIPAPPKATDIMATINVSGSTNTLPYSITIYSDGSAKAVVQGSNSGQTLPASTINVQALQDLLNQTGDVSKITTGFCAKSVSFGTTTTISYNGKTSGDLQCIKTDASTPQAYKYLVNFVINLQAEFKINTARHPVTGLPQ